MPKQKSVKAASKRFKKTGAGNIKRKKAFMRHILTKKSSKTKRTLRKGGLVHPSDVGSVLSQLPYI